MIDNASSQHVVVHENATELANGTLTGGTVPHIGQFFFDQDLITDVYELEPYSTNTDTLTTNSEDRVFGEQETQGTTSDPVGYLRSQSQSQPLIPKCLGL